MEASGRNDSGFRVLTGSIINNTFEDGITENFGGDPSSSSTSMMKAIRMITAENLSQMEIKTKNSLEEMTKHINKLIKDSEDRILERVDAQNDQPFRRNQPSNLKRNSRALATNATSDPVQGLDVICSEEQVSGAIATWLCNRVAADLELYWGNSNISNRSSTLCIALFGIQRKEGLAPYRTALGKDLGIQAREIVSRILWNARCASKRNLNFNGRLPRWLFSLVPACRMSILGPTTNIVTARDREDWESNSTSSPTQQRSNSTQMSQANHETSYDDLASPSLAWEREGKYFREAVWKGCEALEKRRPKERGKKVGRCMQLDAGSELTMQRCVRSGQDQIAIGAQAVRRVYSNILSQNRCNARETFFDAIGFLIHKIKKMGIEEAGNAGFVLSTPALNSDEISAFVSPDQFNSAVRGARVEKDHTNYDEEIDATNTRLLSELTLRFPNLTAKCEYPLTVERKDGEDEVENGDNSNSYPVDGKILRKEVVNLISLSVVVLTELTRKGAPNALFCSSTKSMQAIVSIAVAFRGLIRRSLNQPISPLEQFMIGNTFFNSDDVPVGNEENSTVMSFIQDDSNNMRMNSKLTITRKQYLMEILSHEESNSNIVHEVDSNEDDLFSIPVPILE